MVIGRLAFCIARLWMGYSAAFACTRPSKGRKERATHYA